MPLPSPFYLRLSQPNALTYGELDGNLSILSQKIDNTTGNNLTSGVGLFVNKTVNANDGFLNFRTLVGDGAVNVFIDGNEVVISGSTAPIVDINVTGGTYNPVDGCATFTTNSGSTFEVCGFLTGYTDSFTDAANLSGTSIVFDNTLHGVNFYSVDLFPLISGFTTDACCYWTAGTGNNSVKLINNSSIASGNFAVAEGSSTTASTTNAHAEGGGTQAIGAGSHAEGRDTIAGPGGATHAEGRNTIASGHQAHSEGRDTTASGNASHSAGSGTTAMGGASHAEGLNTLASGDVSHTEGTATIASGSNAHAEGDNTLASGVAAHAAGRFTQAIGDYSYAGGDGVGVGSEVQATGTTSFAHFHYTTAGMAVPSGAYADFSAILGGVRQHINSSNDAAGIFAGTDNTIGFPVNLDSVILGGASNLIDNRSQQSGILAGNDNIIAANSDSSAIVGGGDNIIDGTTLRAAIVGGSELSAVTFSTHSALVGGHRNFIVDSQRAVILGGFALSAATGSHDSGLVGGSANKIINGSIRTVVLGGRNIVATEDDSAYVPQLNIGTVRTTLATANLGIDATGFVTTGSTGGGSFTGNTSGSCITDLWVTNIHGCSPITIHDPIQHFSSTASGINSIAWGSGTTASGGGSHTEGLNTRASGDLSHAEGRDSIASGVGSHAEGHTTIASGGNSHAEGGGGIAAGLNSHVGGESFDISNRIIASGKTSFVHFEQTTASGYIGTYGETSAILGGTDHNIFPDATSSGIFAGSGNTISTGVVKSVVLGGDNITASQSDTAYAPQLNIGIVKTTTSTGNLGIDSAGFVTTGSTGSGGGGGDTSFDWCDPLVMSGNTSACCITTLWVSTISGCSPVTIGTSVQSPTSTASGLYSLAYGGENIASGDYSQAWGKDTTATGVTSTARGENSMAYGEDSHAEGKSTTAGGDQSHAEGAITFALGGTSHAEGASTTASGDGSHSEGEETLASGKGSHAEGKDTRATGDYSHSTGSGTTASGIASTAEGSVTSATTQSAHAEGIGTLASGLASHAEGNNTHAAGEGSHAGGTTNPDTTPIYAGGKAAFAHYFSVEGASIGVVGDTSAILGGSDHDVYSGTTDSVILGGGTNKISGTTALSGIVGGLSNVISSDAAGGNCNGIIGGFQNKILDSSFTVVLGGSKIVGTENNSAYVPQLNIGTVKTTITTGNLGIDAFGFVTTGTTGTGGGGAGGTTIDPYNNVGSASTLTWDVSGTSTNYEITLTGNTILTMLNVRNGDYGTLITHQDGTGNRTLTFGSGTNYVVNGGGGVPTLTATSGTTDILSFTYNGVAMYWTVGNDYT